MEIFESDEVIKIVNKEMELLWQDCYSRTEESIRNNILNSPLEIRENIINYYEAQLRKLLYKYTKLKLNKENVP